ncbi:MAG: hypothetical protein ABI686_05690 [Acidobacteriota bacterium]
MKAKIYLFRLAVGFAAFVCGVGFFAVGRYFQTAFLVKEQKVELVAPAPILTEQTETSVIEQTDVAADSEENSKYEFDIDGYYGIIGELPKGFNDYGVTGKLPKGFEDFGEIGITTLNYENASEENGYEGTPVPPGGYVWTDREYKFAKINVNNKYMSFETYTIKGVSYKFIGKFLEKAPFWKLDEQKPVLEGRFVKLSKGKKVAESDVRFFWYEGGC